MLPYAPSDFPIHLPMHCLNDSDFCIRCPVIVKSSQCHSLFLHKDIALVSVSQFHQIPRYPSTFTPPSPFPPPTLAERHWVVMAVSERPSTQAPAPRGPPARYVYDWFYLGDAILIYFWAIQNTLKSVYNIHLCPINRCLSIISRLKILLLLITMVILLETITEGLN